MPTCCWWPPPVPRGYNDDFCPTSYRHLHLLPLDVSHALHYAERLAGERWGNDPDRVERVLERLHRTGDEETTARLMQSPLQVAIMTLLVDSAGEPDAYTNSKHQAAALLVRIAQSGWNETEISGLAQ